MLMVVGEQDSGEVADCTHVGQGVAEREVIADLGVEEAAIQRVDLQLCTPLVCECDGRLIRARETLTGRLCKRLELYWGAEDESA